MNRSAIEAWEDVPALDVLVLGAGFGGLHGLCRLRERGFNVLALEAAPDVGGTWYWNRYPGARCDVESLVYCYTFSPTIDTEWRWTEQYAGRDEIYAYLRWVADRLDLRKHVRFNSTLVKAAFHKSTRLWRFETQSGERYCARHFLSAAGPITAPILPDIPGIGNFKGQLIHTARWPEANPVFTGKRVGVIGTGSSGTQVIPIVAELCEQLTVFVRTPNFHAPARNRPLTGTDHEWWEENRELTRTRLQTSKRWGAGDVMVPDEINNTVFSRASEFTPEQRRQIYERRYLNGGAVVGWAFCDAMVDREVNEEAADFLRSKIRSIVKDSKLADILTPRGFAYGTKRCTVGTNFYETFNRSNVQVVDVKAEPIRRITATGVVVGDRTMELDVLISASGFDALTGALNLIDIRGEDGQLLKDAWAHGPHTFLGIGVSGFPNMYMVGGPGSPSVLTNVVMTNEMQIDWIADLIEFVRSNGYSRCEVTPEAEQSWTAHVNELVKGTLWETANSWYVGANVAGKPRVILAYVGGYTRYKDRCSVEQSEGYPGFVFS